MANRSNNKPHNNRKPNALPTEHIRMGKQAEFEIFECRNCGNIMRYVLPMPIDVWAAMAKAYAKTHQHCRPRIPVSQDASLADAIHAVENQNT